MEILTIVPPELLPPTPSKQRGKLDTSRWASNSELWLVNTFHIEPSNGGLRKHVMASTGDFIVFEQHNQWRLVFNFDEMHVTHLGNTGGPSTPVTVGGRLICTLNKGFGGVLGLQVAHGNCFEYVVHAYSSNTGNAGEVEVKGPAFVAGECTGLPVTDRPKIQMPPI